MQIYILIIKSKRRGGKYIEKEELKMYSEMQRVSERKIRMRVKIPVEERKGDGRGKVRCKDLV